MTTSFPRIILALFLLLHPSFGQSPLTWTDQTPAIAATWNGVTTGINPVNGAREFLVVGTNTAFGEAATSPDGETWTRRPTGIGGIFHDVTFDQRFPGEYVAVGTNTSAAIVGTSPDGITWTARPTGVGGVLHAVTNSYPRRGLLAVGSTGAGALVITSDDYGRTWTQEAQGGVLPLYGATEGAGLTIAVGTAGTILESVGGLDFVPETSVTANDLYDVTYHVEQGNRSAGWVAVGQNGAILYKPNSTSLPPVWQVVPSITADHLNSVESYNGLLVATGTNGRVLTSPDGLTWSTSPPISITGNHFNGLTAGIGNLGGRWVTVGTNSAIYSSPTTGGVGGGPGTLTVDYSGPNMIAASGQQNLGFTVEATGADVLTYVESSSMIRLINPDPQTIPDGDTVGYAFEVIGNAFEAERTGVIRVVGGSSDITLNFTQAGAPPLEPNLSLIFDPMTPTGEIPLTWSAGGGTTRGFRLEVERPLGSDNWVVLGSGDTTFLDYTDTGLPSWSIQHYRLFATNNSGDSIPAERYIRPRPDTPPDFTAVADGWSRVELTWSDIPEGGAYRIERSLDGGLNWQGVTELGDFSPGTNRFLDTGLPADTLVHYRMTVSGSQNTAEVIPNLVNFWSLPREVTAQTTPYTGQIFWETAVEENLTPPSQKALRSVAHGGGKYVAVGLEGEILSSVDGSTWTTETPPAGLPGPINTHTFIHVVYANGIWLISATTDRLSGPILRSTGDGTWTLHTLPAVWSVRKIVFQNGVFLANALRNEVNAVWGYKGRLFTSTDGISWTAVLDLDDSGSISAGDGQFISTSRLDGVQVSSDGVTWTAGTGSHTGNRAFGGTGAGRWFGTGLDLAFQAYASRSPDGVTWTDGPDVFPGQFTSWIGATPSNFIAILGDRVATSPDSLTWSSPAVIQTGVPFYSVALGTQGWVAIGEGGVIARSSDLINWTIERPYRPANAGSFTPTGVAYGAAGEIVAVGGNEGIWRRDPTSDVWTQQSYPNSPALQPTSINYVGGEFLGGSQTATPTELLRSPDGITWTREVVSSETGTLTSFASGNGVIVAAGSIGPTGKIAVSNDGGTNWITVSRQGREVIFSDGKFFLVGGSLDGPATSADGLNWTPLIGGAGSSIAAGLSEDGYRTIVGVTQITTASPGQSRISIDDGQIWTHKDFGGAEVIYGDGVFIMRKLVNGTIYASLDGLNWELPPPGIIGNDQHISLAEGPGSEVAIGSTGGVVKRLKVSARPIMREEFDGVPDAVEDGAPNGGDGNNDGIPDRSQDHVTSLPTGGGYLTLVSPVGTVLKNVRIAPNAAPADLPLGVSFPFGLLAFEVTGITPGASITVDILYPSSPSVTDYYKYGPLPGSLTPLWYDFSSDGTTGAVLTPGRARLTFVDGARGDDDLTANGRITDDGGPVLTSSSPGSPNPELSPKMQLFTNPGTQDVVTLNFATQVGVRYHLQVSENLVHFEALQRVIALGPMTQLTDVVPDNNWQNRFYRIVEIQ